MKIAVKDFNLEATLDSGQVFGFSKNSDGKYEGVIDGRYVQLYQEKGFLWAEHNGGKISEDSVQIYFDLGHDLSTLYDLLCEDDRLRPVYERFKGLRVIRQDPWEALACFIISSNNNIKRIQGIRRNLSQTFSNSEYLFPKVRHIAQSKENILRQLGLGYRAPFLLRAAKRVSTGANIFGQIRGSNYEKAKMHLIEFPGVGEKVADCVLLFGFQKYEAFPVDVWILRVMRKLYFRNRKVSEREVRAFAQKRWRQYAGYIQQYLYHGTRQGIF